MESENPLTCCRQKLMQIASDTSQPDGEHQAAHFYLHVLSSYTDSVLKKQSGFRRGIGGTGDNVVIMPAVERDAQGVLMDDKGQCKITPCYFEDFQSYLRFIDERQLVQHGREYARILPTNANGLPVDDYQSIMCRQYGLGYGLELSRE